MHVNNEQLEPQWRTYSRDLNVCVFMHSQAAIWHCGSSKMAGSIVLRHWWSLYRWCFVAQISEFVSKNSINRLIVNIWPGWMDTSCCLNISPINDHTNEQNGFVTPDLTPRDRRQPMAEQEITAMSAKTQQGNKTVTEKTYSAHQVLAYSTVAVLLIFEWKKKSIPRWLS